MLNAFSTKELQFWTVEKMYNVTYKNVWTSPEHGKRHKSCTIAKKHLNIMAFLRLQMKFTSRVPFRITVHYNEAKAILHLCQKRTVRTDLHTEHEHNLTKFCSLVTKIFPSKQITPKGHIWKQSLPHNCKAQFVKDTLCYKLSLQCALCPVVVTPVWQTSLWSTLDPQDEQEEQDLPETHPFPFAILNHYILIIYIENALEPFKIFFFPILFDY